MKGFEKVIGIIYIGDLKYAPYVKKYTTLLDKARLKYKILYWSREGESTEEPNHRQFIYQSKRSANLFSKINGFYKYKLWLKRELKDNKYDKLIILSTLSGMIIYKTLLNEYKDKYIYDIRDYSYENISIFRKMEAKLVENSFFTGISSRGFKAFLPESNKYEIVHNYNEDYNVVNNFHKKKSPLNLVWLGSVRYFEHQKKIINHLGNDLRFQLHYHGSGPELEKFKRYVEKKSITNVCFTGEYNNEDKQKLLTKADILNNSYHLKKEMETKYAISNKFYDGIFHKIPQLVEVDTYKSRLVKKYNIGFSLDINKNTYATDLFNSYNSINEMKFNDATKELAKMIKDDNDKYDILILEFLNS